MNLIIYKPAKVCRIEALRTAATFAVALIVSNLFNVQDGYWMSFTIALLYFAGAYHGFVLQRLNRRVIAIIGGLIFGIYFLTLLSFQTYWYLYICSLFFFLGFYFYFLSGGNYFYLAFFLSIYFLLIATLESPPTQNMNLANIVFSRFSCTIFAVIIIIICDVIFFPRSTKPKYTTLPIAKSLTADYRDALKVQNRDFLLCRRNSDAAWNKIYEINRKKSKLEEIVKNIANELCFDDINEERYSRLFSFLKQMRESIESMIFISNHFKGEATAGSLLSGSDAIYSKELLRKYFELEEKPEEDSAEFLYLRNWHTVLWSLERAEKQIELIERS